MALAVCASEGRCTGMMCRAPHNKAILLYGAPGTGKTMLAHAIAHDAGASLFDLSPGVTDGLYPGKKGAALLVQMVFRCAKAFAPSVVLIDGCEKVSITYNITIHKALNPKVRVQLYLPFSNFNYICIFPASDIRV